MKSKIASAKTIRKDALTFLKNNTTAVVASCFGGMPYASTIYYVIDDKFNFYFVTRRKTSKYLNLAINNTVALVVGTGPEHVSVQARGEVVILYRNKKQEALNKIMEMLADNRISSTPLEVLEHFQDKNEVIANAYVVFKFEPTELVFMNINGSKYPGSHSIKIHKLIP